MKEYKTSKEIKPFLRGVLIRCMIPHQFQKKDDGYTVMTPVSGRQFHRYVGRAICEKKTKETGLFYVTKEESIRGEYIASLLESSGRSAYVVLGEKEKR